MMMMMVMMIMNIIIIVIVIIIKAGITIRFNQAWLPQKKLIHNRRAWIKMILKLASYFWL